MKRIALLVLLTGGLFGCAKQLAEATSQTLPTVSRTFDGTANQTYYAIRWALSTRGYPVAFEDLPGGVISSSWVPVKAGSHYIATFGDAHRDYGSMGSYHQLELRVIPNGSRTTVDVTSTIQSIVAKQHSSGSEETAILDEIGHYLRSKATITNLGVEKE